MVHSLRPRLSEQDLHALNEAWEGVSPPTILTYALERYFPGIILACSFGAEDVVVLDMMHQIQPEAPLFYLDTDFLFPETYDVRDRILATYNLKPEQVIQGKSHLTPEAQADQYGPALWLRDPDQCCYVRKVEPLARILDGYQAWITGVRRDQAPSRAHTKFVEWDERFHLVKFNPLAAWTETDVWRYIHTQNVPYNVLHDRDYPSIGCTHCTAPVMPGEDPRAGRWKHSQKTECGLHKP